MSRRTHPADQVVVFFETAPLEQAQTVLAIARGILARRTAKVWLDAKTKRLARKADRAAGDSADAIAERS